MPPLLHTESWRLDEGRARGWLDRFFECWRTSDAAGGSALFTLEADLRWPAEDRWLPLNRAFEAAFVPDEDGEPSCRFWREWKPDAPRRLWHREPHPLDQP